MLSRCNRTHHPPLPHHPPQTLNHLPCVLTLGPPPARECLPDKIDALHHVVELPRVHGPQDFQDVEAVPGVLLEGAPQGSVVGGGREAAEGGDRLVVVGLPAALRIAHRRRGQRCGRGGSVR